MLADSGQRLGKADSVDVAVGDLDQDGDLDIVYANWQSTNEIWINNGKGTFELLPTNFKETRSSALDLMDLDRDGDLDVIVAVSGGEDLVYVNEGDSGFSRTNLTVSKHFGYSVTTQDLNGDQQKEIIFANSGPNVILTWNESNEWYSVSQLLGCQHTREICFGDIDGDQDLDAFAFNRKQPNRVYFNQNFDEQVPPNQYIHFRNSNQQLGNQSSYEVAIGDLDGDADLDAIVANQDHPDQIWLNDGMGHFTKGVQLDFGDNSSWGVRLSDLDSDGDLDAFVVNRKQPNEVWINETPQKNRKQ